MDRQREQRPAADRPTSPLQAKREEETASTQLLQLQAVAGNRATTLVVSRLRSEAMDPQADHRAPTTGVGPAPSADEEPIQRQVVQRHRIPTDVTGPPPPAVSEPRAEPSATDGLQREDGAAAPAEAPAFPAYPAIVSNATINSRAESAWTATKGATRNGSRREQGFWIRWNKDTNAMSAAGAVTAPESGNDQAPTVNLGSKPRDTAVNFTVGSFHTHTPTTFRSVGRPAGPSPEDANADTNDDVAGVVYDYDPKPDGSGGIPAGHPVSSLAHMWTSGPYRRS
jgi:hypothetical protein